LSKNQEATILECRILMPLSVEELGRGMRYATAKMAKKETRFGQGVHEKERFPFESTTVRPNERIEGMFSHKVYSIKSKVPLLLSALQPDDAFKMEELSWNAYPYTKSIICQPDYDRRNYISIESIHLADKGTTENALNLPPELIAKRRVVYLNIYDTENIEENDITASLDPRQVRSRRTGRGPLLSREWANDMEPVMCVYKLLRVNLNVRFFKEMVESQVVQLYETMFLKIHRETFCLIDEWYNMSSSDIDAYKRQITALPNRHFNGRGGN